MDDLDAAQQAAADTADAAATAAATLSATEAQIAAERATQAAREAEAIAQQAASEQVAAVTAAAAETVSEVTETVAAQEGTLAWQSQQLNQLQSGQAALEARVSDLSNSITAWMSSNQQAHTQAEETEAEETEELTEEAAEIHQDSLTEPTPIEGGSEATGQPNTPPAPKPNAGPDNPTEEPPRKKRHRPRY